jgi:hypothetical protein
LRGRIQSAMRLRGISVLLLIACTLEVGAAQEAQKSQSPASESAVYFPTGLIDSSEFFSGFLRSIDEPSLVAAARDRTATMYRWETLTGQSGQMLAVRLTVKPDGTGMVVTTRVAPHGDAPVITKREVSREDVEHFAKVVEESGFWPAEGRGPKRREGKTAYVLDAGPEILEGVRGGMYHAVERRGHGDRFAEVVRCLAVELGGIEDVEGPPPR